ncbi:YncE family protein [Salipiger abyssi]|uniref:YVTN family beta-propeller repeat protein n=1 Tax=Salipiger abyssi TaxID=1250539 RepID=A0A1P8UMI6_9RHOB|nr:YncE family protein [Salipiger abyssi]APZ50622.1 YVTN family beta-propeller repeat protein [Salipiger abyssi]
MRRAPDLALWLALTLAAGPVAGDMAFVTCQNGNAVSVLDLSTGEEHARWRVSGKPAGVAVGTGGTVYTVSPDSKSVRHFSAAGELLADVTLDGGPIGVAHDAQRGRLFVSDWYNARLWVLDDETLALLRTLPAGAAPAGLALSRDGTALAAAERDADRVALYDAETLTLRHSVPVGTRPFGLGFAPDGRLFVGNVGSNDVTVIDPGAGVALATLPVGERPYGVAFAAGRAFVTNQYANTVSVIALDDLRPVATLEVGEYPEGIAATSDGRIAVANWFDNTLSVIDAETLDTVAVLDTADGPRAFGAFILKGELP